jgi:hypothetical protein
VIWLVTDLGVVGKELGERKEELMAEMMHA